MMLSKTSSRLVARKLPSQQSRSILGISKSLDKMLYRAAKGVMPSISKTEQIALGCGTIGTFYDGRHTNNITWYLVLGSSLII
jgi:hypothetical protein